MGSNPAFLKIALTSDSSILVPAQYPQAEPFFTLERFGFDSFLHFVQRTLQGL
jgi:hypothetical protein